MSWTSSANSPRPRRSRGRESRELLPDPPPSHVNLPPSPTPTPPSESRELPPDRSPVTWGTPSHVLPAPPESRETSPHPPHVTWGSAPPLRDTLLNRRSARLLCHGPVNSVQRPSQLRLNALSTPPNTYQHCQRSVNSPWEDVGRPPGDVPRRAGDDVARRVPSCAVSVPRSGVPVHGGAVVQKCTSAHTDTRTFNFPFLFPS